MATGSSQTAKTSLMTPGVLATAPGELDRGRDAQEQAPVDEKVEEAGGRRQGRQRDGEHITTGDRENKDREPAGQLPQWPRPNSMQTRVHTIASAGRHCFLLAGHPVFVRASTVAGGKSFAPHCHRLTVPAVKPPLRTDTASATSTSFYHSKLPDDCGSRSRGYTAVKVFFPEHPQAWDRNAWYAPERPARSSNLRSCPGPPAPGRSTPCATLTGADHHPAQATRPPATSREHLMRNTHWG